MDGSRSVFRKKLNDQQSKIFEPLTAGQRAIRVTKQMTSLPADISDKLNGQQSVY